MLTLAQVGTEQIEKLSGLFGGGPLAVIAACLVVAIAVLFGLYHRSQTDRIARLEKRLDDTQNARVEDATRIIVVSEKLAAAIEYLRPAIEVLQDSALLHKAAMDRNPRNARKPEQNKIAAGG